MHSAPFLFLLALLPAAALAQDPIWKQFIALPNNNTAREHLVQLESRPHLAGTPGDLWTAEFVYSQFQSYGLQVSNYSFDVYLPFPVKATLQGVPPFQYRAVLKETAFPEDPSTSDPDAPITFNGYSPSGTVTGTVVYANYGTVEDFAYLRSMNISMAGRIALVRYGEIYRGDKVANAAESGAIGCLIYSDPITFAPKGTSPQEVYPNTRYLPPQGVQRGSIFEGFGDPLTPGWPASEPGVPAERISPEDPRALLPHIPTQPISYGDAQPILQVLQGPTAPMEWQGGLPFTYHIGPSEVQVQLSVTSDNRVATIHNVCASVTGSSQPDRIVLLGNHRDAWVFGGADPNSGTATMLEIGRSLGILKQRGWSPERTIMMCSWDAEEAGTVGSTEWAERNRDLLNVQLVAYLNVDIAVSGELLTVSAMPSLDDIILSTSKLVPAPDTSSTTTATTTSNNNSIGKSESAAASLYDLWVQQSGGKEPTIGRLGGCSSDYCSFVCHLGVPSVDMGFRDADEYPMYHSVYDDLRWMELFGDPGFYHHVSMAQLWGLVALNIADAAVLPINYTKYAEEAGSYVDATEQLLRSVGAPASVSVEPLISAQQSFAAAAATIAADAAVAPQRGPLFTRLVNDRLMQAERGMLSLGGLRGPAEDQTRSWYRHMVFAPATHNGYASTQFPGIIDAAGYAQGSPASSPKWQEVQHQIWEAARALERTARILQGVLV